MQAQCEWEDWCFAPSAFLCRCTFSDGPRLVLFVYLVPGPLVQNLVLRWGLHSAVTLDRAGPVLVSEAAWLGFSLRAGESALPCAPKPSPPQAGAPLNRQLGAWAALPFACLLLQVCPGYTWTHSGVHSPGGAPRSRPSPTPLPGPLCPLPSACQVQRQWSGFQPVTGRFTPLLRFPPPCTGPWDVRKGTHKRFRPEIHCARLGPSDPAWTWWPHPEIQRL